MCFIEGFPFLISSNIFKNIIKKEGIQIKICFVYCISIETNILL